MVKFGMTKKKENDSGQPGREGVISIIGPGMRVVGDCDTEGTLRIEGTVEGAVRAGKAIVLGKDGVVEGDLSTQDAVIGGRVNGSVTAESRLELQATSVVEGKIRARRIKLDEGGTVNGTIQIGEVSHDHAASPEDVQPRAALHPTPPGNEHHPHSPPGEHRPHSPSGEPRPVSGEY